MNCRHCFSKLAHTFVDLGFAPPSNAYLKKDDLLKPEKYFPLRVMVCDQCWLVQTEDYAQADELFNSDYAYFSSTSSSWLAHAKDYVHKMVNEFSLSKESFVIEVASNDGYLLKNFVDLEIPCLGIEPTASTALASKDLGIPTLEKFFSENLAKNLVSHEKSADLIICNNVYAHVPDINDFTKGLKKLLNKGGVITIEFPHLLRLIMNNQFDTIYHEHFSYLSIFTVSKIFNSFGLRIFRVENLNTHGGSVRVYGCHLDDSRPGEYSLVEFLQEEKDFGLHLLSTYHGFQEKVNKIKDDLMLFLIEAKRDLKKVVAYGAAAKGNTLLNYAGVKTDLIQHVYDAAPSKQGKFMPGSHIPIVPSPELKYSSIDYILILPWNLTKEIKEQLSNEVDSGVKYVYAVPSLTILGD